jgi:hypothetical protein
MYLRAYGSPRSQQAFREQVPVVSYSDVRPWLARIERGEADVLFQGRPVAYERTGGSTGDSKLIPYAAEGLRDFQRSVLPWLAETVKTHRVTGRIYLSTSPATRQPQSIDGVPIGLPDGAYLGEAAAAVLAERSAVPIDVGSIPDVARWRADTLKHLRATADLEIISVWSPTFLLRLLDDLPDPATMWPCLKVVSCWASGASQPFAATLAGRLPHVHLQPKGLLSTECVVTVPDGAGHSVMTPYGFFEFECEGKLLLADELSPGSVHGVVATTASGLYRYRTGDLVRVEGRSIRDGRPILEFVGRGDSSSDLVGEKLTDAFVDACLREIPGFRLLVPERDGEGYVLATEVGAPVSIAQIEARLANNPQYAYARRLGQLKPLRLLQIEHLFDRYVRVQLRRGVRLGDIKPVALRPERTWTAELGSPS